LLVPCVVTYEPSPTPDLPPMGRPHSGHAAADVDTFRSQSGHATSPTATSQVRGPQILPRGPRLGQVGRAA
jgi:hypothetical protein